MNTLPLSLPTIGIAAYQGRSWWPSMPIRWFTWSKYSHIAIWDLNGPSKQQVFEAWPDGGCQWSPNFSNLHKDKTRVDLFSFRKELFPCRNRQIEAREFLDSQQGKGYDHAGIFHMILRCGGDNPNRWFCSEISNRWSRILRCVLVNKPDHKCTPADEAASAVLTAIGYLDTGSEGDGPITPYNGSNVTAARHRLGPMEGRLSI